MKIGSQNAPATAISGSNAETILVRGHNLVDDLIGKVSFTDHAWLVIAGELPDARQRQVLDACLVAIAEHGLVPSVAAARMTLAASPESLQGAVAAGLLGCGSVILGASEAAGHLFEEVLGLVAAGSSPRDAAFDIVRRYRSDKRAIPGYGHPLHKKRDARALRLIALAEELEVAGRYTEVARIVESVVPEVIGKPLSINVSGAIPAVLLDAGFPLLALKGIPLLARTASLIGHLLEERAHPIGFVLANDGAAAVTYSGPAPDGFVADEH